MIPLFPLAATAILFYHSASPSLLAKSVIAEPVKRVERAIPNWQIRDGFAS